VFTTETDPDPVAPDPAAPTGRAPDDAAGQSGAREHSRVETELRRLRSVLG